MKIRLTSKHYEFTHETESSVNFSGGRRKRLYLLCTGTIQYGYLHQTSDSCPIN
jgi:hypothetical protein